MYTTLLDKVKANIDQKIVEQDSVLLRGWAFSDDNGVCPIRCKYESTIRSVDIEMRKDVCDLFGRPNIILSGWKISVPLHKYIDFQIKLGHEWCTFLSYNSVPSQEKQSSEPLPTPLPQSVYLPIQTYEGQNKVIEPPVFVTNLPNIQTISFDSHSSPLSNLYIVDNFYDRPDEVRLFGVSSLQQDQSATDAIKCNTTLKEKLQKIVGKHVNSFSQYEENGRFSLSNRLSPVSFDTKPYQYAGIVFLTPNAPITAGITLYRSKTNSTELEAIDVVGNVYNRLVLFNAKTIHSASHHFGSDIEEGRLVQHFAFDLN